MRFKRLLREFTIRRSCLGPNDVYKINESERLFSYLGLDMSRNLSILLWDIMDFVRKMK